jgi:hypothetical protein
VEIVPHLLAIAWIATPLSVVICFWLWLRYCPYVYKRAIKQGLRPDPQKMIKAASRGPLRRLDPRSRLPMPPKPGESQPTAVEPNKESPKAITNKPKK